jgi:hypothetical protein
MFRFLTRKRFVLPLAAVVALVVAAGAYAYFTSTGTTTGTGAVGTVASTGAFTVSDTTVPVTLYPGTGSFAFAGTITNPSAANLGLGTVVISITAPTVASSAPAEPHACSASDFALTAGSGSGWVLSNGGDTATYTYSANNELNNGQHVSFPTGLSVSMVDGAYNQDNCEGATLNWSDSVSS